MMPNAFELLGLPARFTLDPTELERRQRSAFAHRATEGAMESAMEGAMQGGPNIDLERINEAYRILKDPITRAELLFELRGWPTRSKPEPALLERAFQERETIESAKGAKNRALLVEFVGSARKRRESILKSLAALLDASALERPNVEGPNVEGPDVGGPDVQTAPDVIVETAPDMSVGEPAEPNPAEEAATVLDELRYLSRALAAAEVALDDLDEPSAP